MEFGTTTKEALNTSSRLTTRSQPFIGLLPIQKKLSIGSSNDAFEVEADDIANRVVNMGDTHVQPKLQQDESIQPSNNTSVPKEDIQKKSLSNSISPLVQKKSGASANKQSEASGDITQQVQSSSGGGSPMNSRTQQFMESRFGADFSDVNIHTGSQATQMNNELNAQAFTVGSNIYFNEGKYNPTSNEGKHLLAHELTHTIQQKNAFQHSIQKRPADHASAAYDESKLVINEISDFAVQTAINGTTKYSNLPQSLRVKTTDTTIKKTKWEVYDASDQLVPDADLKIKVGPIVSYPVLYGSNFVKNVKQGRYTARCIGLDSASKPKFYAEESFFIWTTIPLEQQDMAALKKVKANPTKHTLGELGAAEARLMMLEHQKAIRDTGTGTIAGNQCSTAAPTGTAQHDCTTYVLAILKAIFVAKGQKTTWDTIFADAVKNSSGKFKGTELLKSLLSKGGWKAVFWSPDPKNPDDSLSEHPVAYKAVKAKGKYYGIDVEKANSVIDYRKTSKTKRETMSNLDKLKKVPFAVIAAKGGKHMTLLLYGVVYEVHWTLPATDPKVIEATPLEKWGWNSGVIVMPAADYKVAF